VGPWPARLALVAAAGLVVGGVAFAAVEIASALSGPAAAPESEAGPTAESSSERRTTPLTGPDPAVPADEEAGAGGAAGAGTGAREDGTAGTSVAGGGAPDSGAGTGSPVTGGDAPGGTDPRAEILDDMLNSPQERPPMEPLVSQEDVDAEREAAEAGVEPVVP
jgi:hypothetical protein